MIIEIVAGCSILATVVVGGLASKLADKCNSLEGELDDARAEIAFFRREVEQLEKRIPHPLGRDRLRVYRPDDSEPGSVTSASGER